MHAFNISWDKFEIKNILRTRMFGGENNWKPDANVKVNDLMPVYFNDNDKNKIQTMRWGIDRFDNGKLTQYARLETVAEKWNYDGHCVIPVKGFYFKNNENDGRINYYVKNEVDEALFIAGVYFIIKKGGGKQYKVLLLTKSADNDRKLFSYLYRLPVFLPNTKSLNNWLQTSRLKKNILNKFEDQQIVVSKPTPIGDWVNKNIKNEQQILKSRQEWEFEEEAKEVDWEAIIKNN